MKFSFFLSFFFLFLNDALSNEFVVLGHTQSLFKHEEKYSKFMQSLNNINASHIFMLGDNHLGNPKALEGVNQNTIKKIYAVPGNHEYQDGIEFYMQNIGYTNKDIEAKSAIFLLLDSNQGVNDIVEILKKWKEKYFKSDKPKILMTHHRIWDDSVISVSPYKHDKSYYFRDIYPLLSGFVDYIIAGNSKRQHFQDYPLSLENNQPPNVSMTYWEEAFNDFKVYNVGMGNGYPYASYVRFSIEKKKLIPNSVLFKLSNDGLDSYGLVDMNLYSANLRDKPGQVHVLFVLIKKYSAWVYGFIFGAIFVIISLFFARKLNHKKSKHE